MNSSATDVELLTFLVTFSRFEYALKEAEYTRTRSADNDSVEANWDGLENELAKFSEGELKPVLDCGRDILDDPPKKQILNDKKLGFQKSIPDGKDIKKLLIYVRRVRNNLFHGAKIPLDVSRDIPLLKASNAVLLALLELPHLHLVKEYFELR